jgi:methyl-accepting chemotaxis protein
MAESAEGRAAFLVQTYARDTGAIVSVISVPLFVDGERYGVSLLGWEA